MKSNILILEDEPLIRLLLLDGVESAGHAVDGAEYCADALRIAKSGAFDAAIFDLRLPDGNSLDTVRSLRASGIDFPIIVLSAEAQRVEPAVLAELQISAVLPKPPVISDVLDALGQVLKCAAPRATAPALAGEYHVWNLATGDVRWLESVRPNARVVVDCSGAATCALGERVEAFIASAGDRVAVCGAPSALRAHLASLHSELIFVEHLDELAAYARRFSSQAERTALLQSVVQIGKGAGQ